MTHPGLSWKFTSHHTVFSVSLKIEPILLKTGPNLTLSLFIARQHTDARYWYSNSVCLSVRPSVTRWYCMKTAQHIVIVFFHRTVAQSFQFYEHQTSSRNSDGVTPCRSAKFRWGIKMSRFSTNKSLYLANDTRYRHSYDAMTDPPHPIEYLETPISQCWKSGKNDPV